MKDFPDWFFDKTSWQEKTLGDVLEIPISNGVFCDPRKKGSGKKIINVSDLYNDFFIDESKLEFFEIDEKDFERNKVCEGDLFFTRSSVKVDGIGQCNIYLGNGDNVTFDGHIMRVRLNNSISDSKFVKLQFSTKKIRSQIMKKAKTNAMTTIGQEDLSQIKIKIPPLETQKKIAEYFTHLDNAINAQDLKLKSWRDTKKAMLQKIFSQEFYFTQDNGEKYPAWQEKTLGEVCSYISKRGTCSQTEYVGTENMLQNFSGVNFKDEIEKNFTGISYQVDDILFSNIRPYLKKVWKADKKGCASTDILVIRAEKNIFADFLYYSVANDEFISKVMTSAKGTKMPRGDKNFIMNLKIKIPCVEEQKKIAEYFTHLDNAINAQDLKLKSWCDAKKAMLQKIFSQDFYFTAGNGEKYPAWQEKNFDDIFKDVSEKNFPDLEVLTIMQGYGTVPRRNSGIDIKFTEESKKNYKKVSEGDFIIHLRSFQGGFEMANSEGIVSPAYTILKNKLPIAENFYKNYFRSHNFISGKLAKFVEGIRDGRQINYNQLKTVKIPFPCLEEQKKIAEYFSSFDKIIDAESKMLESLRQMKRGLLQKLFV